MRSLIRIFPARRLPAVVLGHFIFADRLAAELFPRQLVAPVAEGALGKLHDVAFVNQGHHLPLVVDGMTDGTAHQVLGSRDRNGLNPDARVRQHLLPHFLAQEINHLLGFRCSLLPFNAGIDVFGVLTEDDHIHLFRDSSPAKALPGSTSQDARRQRDSGPVAA